MCVDDDYLQCTQRLCESDQVFDVSGLRPANEGQKQAVLRAMEKPFFLIQGPPGTGKSVTAARLAVVFYRLNRTLPASYNRWLRDSAEQAYGIRPQVMVCGPTNKSVDVLAGTHCDDVQ